MKGQYMSNNLIKQDTNKQAVQVNCALGLEIFDESCIAGLKLKKYTAKQIKLLMIDDLISNGKATARLIKITNEVLERKLI
jgi:hypothetical protein